MSMPDLGKCKVGKSRHAVRFTILCLYCGSSHPTTRPDTKTCSAKCRRALHAYKLRHGSLPLFPFGVEPSGTLSDSSAPPRPAPVKAPRARKGAK
jgi:predicted nucleic acid-binding Zn ribbon protein